MFVTKDGKKVWAGPFIPTGFGPSLPHEGLDKGLEKKV